MKYAHKKSVFTLDYSEDGKLASGFKDKSVKVWGLEDLKLQEVLPSDSAENCVYKIKFNFYGDGGFAVGYKNGALALFKKRGIDC